MCRPAVKEKVVCKPCPHHRYISREQWLILVPKKWNPTTHKAAYSWRYDPRELGDARATPADARREH